MKRSRSIAKLKLDDNEVYKQLNISKKKIKKDKTQMLNNKTSVEKRKKSKSIKGRSKIKSKELLNMKKIKTDRIHSESDNEDILLQTKLEDNNNLLGPVRIRLGLCCINNYLKIQKPQIFSSRSITVATYKSKGKSEAIDRALKNVKDVKKILLWNKAHYIDCLRLSSDMFPHYTNIKHIDEKDQYSLDFARDELEKAGDLARELGQRITMHPGQFNVVGSPNEEFFQKTVLDLKMHADILDMMKMDKNSIMVVHGGGVYGDKKKTIQRWIDNFRRLPECVQNRLVLENCEKNFSIVDCLEVNKALGIPVVFDNHHFLCYKQAHPGEEFQDIRYYIKLALETWTNKGLRPKFHISEQAPGKVLGAHSDYIDVFPDYYLEIPEKYGIGVDVMIEAKAKEAAIFDIYQRYPFLSNLNLNDANFNEIFKFDRNNLMAVKCPKC